MSKLADLFVFVLLLTIKFIFITMVWMNKTPFKLSLNSKGNDCIAHRKATMAPLATIFEGDNDKVYPFTRAFAARIESVVIETTFGVKTTLDPRTPSSNESDATKKTLDE
jgi:hypothetical protein